jgi:protein sprouty homolog 2
LASQQLSVIQPASSTLKKRSDLGPPSDFDSAPSSVTAESIICRDCGRCRCKACREPRRLPEHYLCHKKCLCSTETVVDTLSGMCLVKALFYHCGKDYASEADSVFENPCSCTGDYAAARWGCMAAMSLVMPCLLCYLPMKGCSEAAEAVYAKMTTSGCRCDSNNADGGSRNNNVDAESTGSESSAGMPSPVDSEKRLLGEL